MNYLRRLLLLSVLLCNAIIIEAAKKDTSYYCLSKSRIKDFLMSFDFNLVEQLKIHHESNDFKKLDKNLSDAFERAKQFHQLGIFIMPDKNSFLDQLIYCFGPSEEITRTVKKFINKKIRETNKKHTIKEQTKLASNWIEASPNTTLNFVCKCIKNFLKNYPSNLEDPDCLFIFTALVSQKKSIVYFYPYVPSLNCKKAQQVNTDQGSMHNQQQELNNNYEEIS